MSRANLQRGPWPWRWEPAKSFHHSAVHGRISAGFEIRDHMVEDREYERRPELVDRDLVLLMVMAGRRAKQAGRELDFAEIAETARAELARLEREGTEE